MAKRVYKRSLKKKRVVKRKSKCPKRGYKFGPRGVYFVKNKKKVLCRKVFPKKRKAVAKRKPRVAIKKAPAFQEKATVKVVTSKTPIRTFVKAAPASVGHVGPITLQTGTAPAKQGRLTTIFEEEKQIGGHPVYVEYDVEGKLPYNPAKRQKLLNVPRKKASLEGIVANLLSEQDHLSCVRKVSFKDFVLLDRWTCALPGLALDGLPAYLKELGIRDDDAPAFIIKYAKCEKIPDILSLLFRKSDKDKARCSLVLHYTPADSLLPICKSNPIYQVLCEKDYDVASPEYMRAEEHFIESEIIPHIQNQAKKYGRPSPIKQVAEKIDFHLTSTIVQRLWPIIMLVSFQSQKRFSTYLLRLRKNTLKETYTQSNCLF